jgi:lipopolysaccharide export system protein LptC
MRTRLTHLLPLGLMLLLAAMTLWLQYVVQQDTGDVKAARHEPDAIVENFTVNRLDEFGKLQYTFSSPKMLHFPDNDSAEALYPRVVYIAREGGNLVATASRGVIHRQGEEAYLYGNVLILREATLRDDELRARTEFLHLLSKEGVARTDRSVTITEGRSVLNGVGMLVNRNKQEFILQSQVRGSFDAPKGK